MPCHADASVLALELVLAVVDATTAMDVVEALRHTPELLHALGESVPDARARFTCFILPILGRAREVAPDCHYVLWGPADSTQIGPWALRMLQMSTVDPQVHAASAHMVADCFEYMNVDDDDYRNEYILNAIRESGFHRALVARLSKSEGAMHHAYSSLLCTVIMDGYLYPYSKTLWSCAQIAEDLGGVCLESLLLQCLQNTSGDVHDWGDLVHCLRIVMYQPGGFSLAAPFSTPSRRRLFGLPDVRGMLRGGGHDATPCADRRRRCYQSGLFDVLLQRMGALDTPSHNESCAYVLEMLFITCSESRCAVFDGVCAKARGDMQVFHRLNNYRLGSLSDHFKYMHTR